jgi:hypothetical protein
MYRLLSYYLLTVYEKIYIWGPTRAAVYCKHRTRPFLQRCRVYFIVAPSQRICPFFRSENRAQTRPSIERKPGLLPSADQALCPASPWAFRPCPDPGFRPAPPTAFRPTTKTPPLLHRNSHAGTLLRNAKIRDWVLYLQRIPETGNCG